MQKKAKEYNKKIEIIKREIEYELKKKDIINKINNDNIQNINKTSGNKLNNITDANIITDSNKNNDLTKNESDNKIKYFDRNIFNKNNNIKKNNIFNFYLRQFNENRNKKRKENIAIKKMLNSNINDNFNEIKSFSNINSESNDDMVLNIKLTNNNNYQYNNTSQTNRSLFTKTEKDFLLKLIPDKCLDNYENKYDSLMKENLSLQSKLNDKIRLKTLAKQNNLIKLENSELINNVYYKKKLKLDTKINESNNKKHEINEKIKHIKKLLNYYDAVNNQKNGNFNKLLNDYRKICDEIRKGNLLLKKGVQLTQENILCMDKYGKKSGDNTSFNDIDDDRDHGKVSELFEETGNNGNNIDNDENEAYNDNYDE